MDERGHLAAGEIERYLATGQGRGSVEQHLAICDRCLAELAAIRISAGARPASPELVSAVKQAVGRELRGAITTRRADVKPEVARSRRLRLTKRRGRAPSWRVGLPFAAAAAVLALAAALLLQREDRSRPTDAPVARTGVGSQPGPEPPEAPRRAEPREPRVPGPAVLPVARVTRAGRAVEWLGDGRDGWRQVREDLALLPGDRIRTGRSRARVLFGSGSVLTADPHTELAVEGRGGNADVFVSVGVVHVETGVGTRDFCVATPHGLARDVGTHFRCEVSPSGTAVLVLEGAVEARTEAGAVRVPEGHEVFLANVSAPPGPVRAVCDAGAGPGRTEEPAQAYESDLEKGTILGGSWRITPTEAHVRTSENAFLLFGRDDWCNYRVSVLVRVEGAEGGNYGVGVVGYWLDERRLFRFRNHASVWELTRSYGHKEGYRKLARLPAKLPVGSELRIVLEVETTAAGAVLRAKSWPASDGEPESWLLEARSPARDIAAGRAGLWACNCSARFSEIEVKGIRDADAERIGGRGPAEQSPW